MFERYTEMARRVVFHARSFASELGSPLIEPEHILLAILKEDAELFAPWIKSEESLKSLRIEVEQMARGPQVDTATDIALSEAAKQVLAHGAEEAERLGQYEIRPAHLLAGVARDSASPAGMVLRKHGVDAQQARLVFIASSSSQPPIGAESGDLHELVDLLPRSELGRARVLLQALLGANRPAGQ